MLLSSNIIKQVSSKMEGCPVYPKIIFGAEGTEQYVNYDLDSAREQADTILVNARNEAETLLRTTNDRIAKIEQETYERGYRKGEQDAKHNARRAQEEFYASTAGILKELEEIRERTIRDTEAELVQLAVGIAEKLVCRQLDIEPETIVDMVKAACRQAGESKQVIIYARPEQISLLSSRQSEIASQFYNTHRIRLIDDPNIKMGGCRIETEQGCIDATIDTMLRKLDSSVNGLAS